MQFSEYYNDKCEFIIFLKKCKQTAEISWLFFWDVKISKKFVKQKFSIFYPYVTAYLHLCSQTTQQQKISCQYPCFVINCHMPAVNIPKANFLYFVCDISFLNFIKNNPKKITRNIGKIWKNYKTRWKSANFSGNTDRKV